MKFTDEIYRDTLLRIWALIWMKQRRQVEDLLGARIIRRFEDTGLQWVGSIIHEEWNA